MKSEKKKQVLRESIVRTAMTLIREQGYNAVTMEEIARQSEVSKRTLYQYFHVKEAVIEEYIRITLTEQKSSRMEMLRTLQGLENRVSYYLTVLLEGVQRESELFEKYIVFLMQKMVSFSKKETTRGSGIADPLIFILGRGFEEGEINADLNPSLAADLFLFCFVELCKVYYSDPEGFDMTAEVKSFTSLFLRAISYPDYRRL